MILTRFIALAIALVAVSLPSHLSAARMYWSDSQYQAILSSTPEGADVKTAIHIAAQPQGIAVDSASQKVYWVDLLGIQRANLDGTNVEMLLPGTPAIAIALDVSGGKMYWTDSILSGYIRRANLDGSNVEDIFPAGPVGLALDTAAGKMYWTNAWAIVRANLDGTGVELLVRYLQSPREIALDLDDGKIYWAETAAGKVGRANLDGSAVEYVATDLVNPAGIALDLSNSRVYWTDFGRGVIQSAGFDGSGKSTIVTSLFPVGIAFAEDPPSIEVPIDIKPATFPNAINSGSRGKIPVAILSSAGFDASARVVESSLTFGRTGDEASLLFCSGFADVNGDGLLDLVCHFDTALAAFREGDTQGFLKGVTTAGTPLAATDSVLILK